MTEERWRPVVGYEGIYEVSDQGRVWSLDRIVERRGGSAPGHPMRVRGRQLVIARDKLTGYGRVNLNKEGRGLTRLVHGLVMAAFVGPRPPGMEIRHLDGDGGNCNLSNLAYGYSTENKWDSVRHGTHYEARRTHCPSNHPYDAENTYILPSRPRARYCRTCHRERSRKSA